MALYATIALKTKHVHESWKMMKMIEVSGTRYRELDDKFSPVDGLDISHRHLREDREQRIGEIAGRKPEKKQSFGT